MCGSHVCVIAISCELQRNVLTNVVDVTKGRATYSLQIGTQTVISPIGACCLKA